MSGTGKKQRTKGNMKPSSSARAAELLSAAGYEIPNTVGFMGFDAIPGNYDGEGSTISSVTGTDEPEELDDDFRCVLRKAMKKDTVTKTKALREIGVLISDKDTKIVEVAWQCWPRLYSRLALDGSFKVRELAHVTLGAFVQKLGRQATSQLKNVLPYWLMGENDPYQISAQAAKQTLQDAFPADKRRQVLSFCKESIIVCSTFVLSCGEIAVTSSSSTEDDEESPEARNIRLCSCALAAIYTLLSTIPDEELAKVEDSLRQDILSSPKFWKLHEKAKISNVRVSWLNLISCLIRRCYRCIADKSDKLVPIIVNVLDATDASLLVAAWNCLTIYLDTNNEDFWSHCNVRKAFMPKLIAVIKKAFNGCANAIGQSVNKSITRMPKNEDALELENKILEALHAGCIFCLDSKTSSTEISAFIKTYCEYIKNFLSNHSSNSDVIAQFLTQPDKALFVMSACLKSKSPSLILESFEHLASMIKTITEELPADTQGLSDAVTIFQTNLCQLVEKEVDAKSSIESLSKLLIAVENRASGPSTFDVASICRKCWILYNETGDIDYLRIIRIVLCGLVDIPSFLMRYQNEAMPLAIDKFAADLLNRASVVDGNTADENEIGLIYDCCFALCKVCDTAKKTDILRTSCKLKSQSCNYQLLVKLRQLKDNSLIECLPKSEFCELFINCFKSICSSLASTSSKDLVNQWCIMTEYLASVSTNEGPLLSVHTAGFIFEYLQTFVRTSTNDVNNWSLVTLVAQLASDVLVSRLDFLIETRYTDLIGQLFDLYCVHSDDVTDEALKAMQNALISALSKSIFSSNAKVENSMLINLTKRLVEHVHQSNMNRERLEWLSSVTMTLVSVCRSEKPADSWSLVSVIFDLLSIEQLALMESLAGRDINACIIDSVIYENFPVYDLDIYNVTTVDLRNLDTEKRNRFLSIAVYGICLYHRMQSQGAPLMLLHSDVMDQISIAITCGFSALSYVKHLTSALSICGCTDDHINLRSFGIWLASVVGDFWNSFNVEERKIISVLAATRILNYGILAVQSMEYLQYTLDDDCQPMDSSIYADTYQSLVLLCSLSSSVTVSNYENVFHANLSIRNVSKFLQMVASCDSVETKINAFNWLMLIKAEFLDEKLLFSCDIGDRNEEVVLNLALMRFFRSLIRLIPRISNEQRDFLLCATLTWLQSCMESNLSDHRVLLFALFSVQLFVDMASCIESIKDNPDYRTIVDEWTGFFLKGCIQILVPVYLKLTRQAFSAVPHFYLLKEISTALTFAKAEDLLEMELPVLLAPELDALEYPAKLQTILLSFLPLLESPNIASQVAAFWTLEKFTGRLYEFESKSVLESDTGETRQLPAYFCDPIASAYERIEHELDHVHHLEESPSFSTYLLTWKLLLEFFATIKTEDRPTFYSSLWSSKMLDKLMLTLLAVLPENVVTTKDGQSSNADFNSKLLDCVKVFDDNELKARIEVDDVPKSFLHMPAYSSDLPTTAYVQRLACHILFETLRTFPAAVRHWFSSQEKRVATLMERFVTKYVSPILCSFELQMITKGEKKYDNMTLVARPGAREVVACYKLEELTMELVVTLPPNYPLTAATVDINRRVGVRVEQWRKWMLQLTIFLSHQNGGLLDGMLLWKRCIDKHLQGVEDCMICMMAVHGSNYQLPKITCKQCKKKFHAACLYKWFNTSSNTSCPLCRTTF